MDREQAKKAAIEIVDALHIGDERQVAVGEDVRVAFDFGHGRKCVYKIGFKKAFVSGDLYEPSCYADWSVGENRAIPIHLYRQSLDYREAILDRLCENDIVK